MSAESERNKAIVRELTEEIWNRRALGRIPEFHAPDYVADYRPYAPLREGHEAIRGMVERAWEAFPDYHEELHDLVAEGPLVVARFTISGTQSGRWGVLRPSRSSRMTISSNSTRFPVLTALRQLGVLPTPPSA